MALKKEGIAPEAVIWVHAQNDSDGKIQIALAKQGYWISLDGVNQTDEAIAKYVFFVKDFKDAGLLHKLLLSHDDGFAVSYTDGKIKFDAYDNGNKVPYSSLFALLKPALLMQGLTEEEFNTITIKNPQCAFAIAICRAK